MLSCSVEMPSSAQYLAFVFTNPFRAPHLAPFCPQMQIFCFFLVLEVIESLLKLSGALDGMGPCIPVQACANTPLDVHNGHSFPESTHSYLWHAVPAARHAMQSDVSPAHPLDPVQL